MRRGATPVAIALALLSGCAPALPSFAGGRTVPDDRSDLLLGGAVRVNPDVDLGLDVSGANLRASARGQVREGTVRFIGGISGFGGAVLDPGAAGRLGVSLPLTLAVDLFSVVELWLGVRASLEHVFGDLDPGALTLTGLRTGGVLGLAVGFRRIHVLLELGVDHEYWFGRLGGVDFERNGVAFTPAFALRIRI